MAPKYQLEKKREKNGRWNILIQIKNLLEVEEKCQAYKSIYRIRLIPWQLNLNQFLVAFQVIILISIGREAIELDIWSVQIQRNQEERG